MGTEVLEMTGVSLHPGIDLARRPAPLTVCNALCVCVCIYRWGCQGDRRHLCQRSPAGMIAWWCPISRPAVHLKESADCLQRASSRWFVGADLWRVVLLIDCIFGPLFCCGSSTHIFKHWEGAFTWQHGFSASGVRIASALVLESKAAGSIQQFTTNTCRGDRGWM